MHVITRKRLNEFADKHPDVRSSLAHWYAIMKKARFLNFVQLRETFPQADHVGKFTVFNIGGNKVRLVAAVHYRARLPRRKSWKESERNERRQQRHRERHAEKPLHNEQHTNERTQH